jgi:CubicO group peptidase (beta-lactamase class C family)
LNKKIKILFFLLPLLSFSQDILEGIDLSKLNKIEDFIDIEIENKKIAGAEFLLARNEAIVSHIAVGFSNLKTKEKLIKNSIYFIQSMTKPIISVAIMQLYERGLISLDENIEKYIPEISKLEVSKNVNEGIKGSTTLKNKIITIAQLLNHTSGISHGLGNSLLDKEVADLIYGNEFSTKGITDYKLHSDLESRINALLKSPLVSQPGSIWYYGSGADLLALIIERVTKKSIPDYLKENIFDPLKMNDTGYNIPKNKLKRLVKLHKYDEQNKFILSANQPPNKGNTLYGGTHGLFSTPFDYLKFCQMILNDGILKGNRILKSETVELIKQNSVNDLFYSGSQGFGYGFAIEYTGKGLNKTSQKGILYWGGYFNTRFFIDTENNIISIWMTQKLPNLSVNGYHKVMKKYVYESLIN